MSWNEPSLPWDGPQVTTPYRGSSRTTEATSKAGAMQGYPKAGSQSWTIYMLVRERPRTMHELQDRTGLAINIICARVGWLRKNTLVRDSGQTRIGPANVPNVIWETT